MLMKYLFILLGSIFFSLVVLIALPLTEQILPNVNFDLQTKRDSYWTATYQLNFDEPESIDTRQDIWRFNLQREASIDTLARRLNRYGVEHYSFDLVNNQLTLNVTTTKDKTVVEQLIRSRFHYEIVIRKPGVDFEDPENQFAFLLEENYNKTGLTNTTFRTVYIKKLDTATGEKNYFAIFKPWPHHTSKFNDALRPFAGQLGGVDIDGFVTPIQIPESFASDYVTQTSSRSGTTRKTPVQHVLAINLGADKQTAEIYDILYNSGYIPLNYTVTPLEAQDHVSLDTITYEHAVYVVASVFLVVFAYFALTKQISKSTTILLLSTNLFSFATWITYLKLSHTSIDIFMILYVVFTLFLFSKHVLFGSLRSKTPIYGILIILISGTFLLTGFNRIFAIYASEVIFIGIVMKFLLEKYWQTLRQL